jgi:hypothetical protein
MVITHRPKMENCINNFRPNFKAQLEDNGLREVIYKDP